MYRILTSLLVIGAVSLVGFSFTRSFFSDTETSANNTFTAGAIDLHIGNASYYNGNFSQETSWPLKASLGTEKFFDFPDLKPSDWGEDTLELQVQTNDAWACAEVVVTRDDDATCTDSEMVDDPSCAEPNDDLFDGELGQLVNYIIWVDDGDNVLETDEATPGAILAQGTLDTLHQPVSVALADSLENNLGGVDGEPMLGNQSYHLGKAWCFGAMTLAPVAQGGNNSPLDDPGFTCDGSNLNNASQTDVLEADISFNVIQARNNPDFVCERSPILVDSFTLVANDSSGATSAIDLEIGTQYLIKAIGTWSNRNGLDSVDAEFNSYNNWTTHMDGDPAWTTFGLTEYSNLLDLQLDNTFVDWGDYSSTHSYEHVMAGTGAPLSVRIFDGIPDTNTVIPSWYGDNSGSLTIEIYEMP